MPMQPVNITATNSASRARVGSALFQMDLGATWLPGVAMGNRTVLEWLAEFTIHLSPPAQGYQRDRESQEYRKHAVLTRLDEGRPVATYTMLVEPIRSEDYAPKRVK